MNSPRSNSTSTDNGERHSGRVRAHIYGICRDDARCVDPVRGMPHGRPAPRSTTTARSRAKSSGSERQRFYLRRELVGNQAMDGRRDMESQSDSGKFSGVSRAGQTISARRKEARNEEGQQTTGNCVKTGRTVSTTGEQRPGLFPRRVFLWTFRGQTSSVRNGEGSSRFVGRFIWVQRFWTGEEDNECNGVGSNSSSRLIL